MAETENRIVYSSGLIINDPAYLSSLCVFYDRVYLPYTSAATQDLFEFSDGTVVKSLGIDDLDIANGGFFISFPNSNSRWDLSTWYRKNLDLFKEGALVQLSKPDDRVYQETFEFGLINRFQGPLGWCHTVSQARVEDIFIAEESEVKSKILQVCDQLELNGDVHEDKHVIRRDLLFHLLRKDIVEPEIFISDGGRIARDIIVSTMSIATLSYLLPSLSQLEVEQILEIRNKVSSTREGFALHLQRLSKGVDGRIKSGEDIRQVARWARDVVETDLIPDYREFKRQLQAGKGWLDPLGRILEISSNPLQPKLYGDLLRAFGIKIPNTAEQVDHLSNKSQAFQFMQAVEESKVAKYQRRSR